MFLLPCSLASTLSAPRLNLSGWLSADESSVTQTETSNSQQRGQKKKKNEEEKKNPEKFEAEREHPLKAANVLVSTFGSLCLLHSIALISGSFQDEEQVY